MMLAFSYPWRQYDQAKEVAQNPAASRLATICQVDILHVISLAQFGMAYTRGWAVNSPIARLRLKAENDQLKQDIALLKEEIRIKDARMNRSAQAATVCADQAAVST